MGLMFPVLPVVRDGKRAQPDWSLEQPLARPPTSAGLGAQSLMGLHQGFYLAIVIHHLKVFEHPEE
jgi:hypothetical protein